MSGPLSGGSPSRPWDDDPIPFPWPIPGPWCAVLRIANALGAGMGDALPRSPIWEQVTQTYPLILTVVRDMRDEREADWRDSECRDIAVWLTLRFTELQPGEPISAETVRQNLDLIFDLVMG